jgi:hypothetical protein
MQGWLATPKSQNLFFFFFFFFWAFLGWLDHPIRPWPKGVVRLPPLAKTAKRIPFFFFVAFWGWLDRPPPWPRGWFGHPHKPKRQNPFSFFFFFFFLFFFGGGRATPLAIGVVRPPLDPPVWGRPNRVYCILSLSFFF